jgi:hypothetical protein
MPIQCSIWHYFVNEDLTAGELLVKERELMVLGILRKVRDAV